MSFLKFRIICKFRERNRDMDKQVRV